MSTLARLSLPHRSCNRPAMENCNVLNSQYGYFAKKESLLPHYSYLLSEHVFEEPVRTLSTTNFELRTVKPEGGCLTPLDIEDMHTFQVGI